MGAVKRKPKSGGRRKRPPDPHDEADRQALDRAVETMIQNVLTGWDYSRPVSSLNKDDLRKLAKAAVTGWILERAKLASEREDILSELVAL